MQHPTETTLHQAAIPVRRRFSHKPRRPETLLDPDGVSSPHDSLLA